MITYTLHSVTLGNAMVAWKDIIGINELPDAGICLVVRTGSERPIYIGLGNAENAAKVRRGYEQWLERKGL